MLSIAPLRFCRRLTLLLMLALAPHAWAAIPVIDPELSVVLRKAAADSESFADRFEAEVWLADMSRRLANRVPDRQYRVEMLKMVHREATRVGLMPELVLAIIDIESAFNPYAISSAGAQGLMQVMPFWLKEIGRPSDNLFRLQTNLRFGCTILKFYLDKENQNLFAALKRYNGTRENHYSLKVDKLLRTRWYRQ
jgi:soluble lytic murein transglycosylase-like protein